MPPELSEKTKDFIAQVNTLIDKGVVKNYMEIVNELKWNKTVMSAVMNAKKNVPNEVYRKFKEVYHPVEITNIEETAIRIALENKSINVVLLRALAEMLSKHRGESLAKTLGDLEAAVRQEQKALLDRLR